MGVHSSPSNLTFVVLLIGFLHKACALVIFTEAMFLLLAVLYV